MNQTFKELEEGKKIYFASDFHLGAPDKISSRKREEKIVRWLDTIKDDAGGILLVGDIFDFWFEYKNVVPKGFSLFLSKLKEIRNMGIPVYFFTGNHDIWMFDYFPDEFGIEVLKKPTQFNIAGSLFYIAHGDGLGPGDRFYKFVKLFFTNKFCQWCFKWLHPTLGIGLANFWSGKSRLSNNSKEDEFYGDKEWLIIHSKNIESKNHHDFYMYGHRHIPTDLQLSESSRYINLGEWISKSTFAQFDGEVLELKTFEG
ncbi:MAG: UDP-2,3-diacylglucosamine diphosphatase [bacterium]|nr:UDP-2,3-diacylglucosamine diphosphatase [bacterium]